MVWCGEKKNVVLQVPLLKYQYFFTDFLCSFENIIFMIHKNFKVFSHYELSFLLENDIFGFKNIYILQCRALNMRFAWKDFGLKV